LLSASWQEGEGNGRPTRELFSDSLFKQLSVVIPAKAGIQYAASYRFNHRRLGILDRPPSQAMTMEIQRVGITSHSRHANAPEFCINRFAPSEKRAQATLNRGRRECRVPDAPMVSCKKARGRHHRFIQPGIHSLHNGFTVSFVLSSVTGLLSPSPRGKFRET
jgi:hypothetical protein